MKYPPGSFSKNFAWHGTGLRKLHRSIRAGFGGKLEPVSRARWRAGSRIDDAALELIPLNFFLFNEGNALLIDELAFQAISRAHTIRFDRLALFALHLSQVGTPPGRAVGRPAMWANEFVREKLWKSGLWQTSALADASLDAFIVDRMDARPDVRVKCRNNYRHIFELCSYWPTSMPQINSGAEQWIASALYLAWDRSILNGGALTRGALLDLVANDDLYKLMGVTEAFATSQATQILDSYIQVGGPNRFSAIQKATKEELPEAEEDAPSWLDQEGTDEVVERRVIEIQQQKRSRKTAASLKGHYKNTCMLCGVRLQIAEEQFYSEAAHIRPIGKPHDGPDKSDNMLVLCPNHHLQFDRGILSIKGTKGKYKIVSKVADDPLHLKELKPTHALDDDCIDWHSQWFAVKRN